MSDITLKGAHVTDTIRIPDDQPGSLTFYGSDGANMFRIDGDGTVTFGSGYDRAILANQVGIAIAKHYRPRESGDVFQARLDPRRASMGFDITPTGDVSFVNWLPSGEAAEFIHALAYEYARALGTLVKS